MKRFRVRDYIYVDIERLKSIISQTEEGLINLTEETRGNSTSASGGGKGKVPFLLEGHVEAEVNLHRQISETRSLHDYIYNRVESYLVEHGELLELPNSSYPRYSDDIREVIGDTSFVLIKGLVNINDFGLLRSFIEHYGDLASFLVECNLQNQEFKTNAQRQKATQQLTKELTGSLDKNMRSGFMLFFDLFYKDRVVIKSIPYKDNPDFRFVGNIDKTYLRDDISSIIYKYGTAPVSEWTIFGQVSSIPPEDRSHEGLNMSGTQIETALQGIFDAFRGVEIMAQCVMFPEIAITPIAIYRESR